MNRIRAIENDRSQLRAELAAFLSRMVTISQAQDVKIGNLQSRLQTALIQLEQQKEPKIETGPLLNAATKTGRLIDKHFNQVELYDLAADFNIEYENIEGDTPGYKARELANMMTRRGELGSLVRRCVELRPKAYGWPIQVIKEY